MQDKARLPQASFLSSFLIEVYAITCAQAVYLYKGLNGNLVMSEYMASGDKTLVFRAVLGSWYSG